MDTNFMYIFAICLFILNITTEEYIRFFLLIVCFFLISGYIYKYKESFQEMIINPGISKKTKTVEQKIVIDEKSIISKLDKFKKYNDTSYNNGIKYHNILKKKISKLQDGKYIYPGNYIHDLYYYLNLCINNFQEISIKLPSTTYKQSINMGKFEENNLSNELHSIVKNLYEVNIKQINKINEIYRDSKNVNEFYTYDFPGPQANNDKNEYELY